MKTTLPMLFSLLSLTAAACSSAPVDHLRTDLEGTWSTGCYPSPSFGGAKTTLKYTNLHLVGTFDEFSDNACTQPRHTTVWEGTASNGEELGPGVRKLDLAFTAFRSKPLTQAEADLVNNYGYCGIKDWAPNVERDVLGKDCVNFSIPQNGKSFDIEKSSATSILFGKNAKIGATVSEADRPTAIDDTRVFTKQ